MNQVVFLIKLTNVLALRIKLTCKFGIVCSLALGVLVTCGGSVLTIQRLSDSSSPSLPIKEVDAK